MKVSKHRAVKILEPFVEVPPFNLLPEKSGGDCTTSDAGFNGDRLPWRNFLVVTRIFFGLCTPNGNPVNLLELGFCANVKTCMRTFVAYHFLVILIKSVVDSAKHLEKLGHIIRKRKME